MITVKTFGVLRDGREVKSAEIKNSFGEYAEILNYGASVNGIFIRDRKNNLTQVSHGIEDVQELGSFNKLGITIGRVAGRIRQGRFELEGSHHQMELDQRGQFLHSGSSNWASKLFEMDIAGEDTVNLHYYDKGGSGFQAPVDVNIRFTFDDEHRLTISYNAVPEATTLIAPTNHCYFNLNGMGDIRDDELMIGAEEIAVKEQGIPNGERRKIENTLFDYRTASKIGDVEKKYAEDFFANHESYDDVFLLSGKGFRGVAELYAPSTGISMEVKTDMPALVLFIPSGKPYHAVPGEISVLNPTSVCLECQYIPNAVNLTGFDKGIFRKEERYLSQTAYEFKIRA